MKISKETRTIEVPVIEIDGVKIDVKHVNNFIDEAFTFESTIGQTGDYTSDFLYFKTSGEKELEPILLKHNVIRKPESFKEWNDKVEEFKNDIVRGGYYNYTRYWLGDGYLDFKKAFWDEYNKL